MNICLIISGSVAAYKACELTSRLNKAGHTVQTVLSEGALHFIGESTLEALSGRPVYTDLWARRENMTHINLRRWADLFVFYPATANRINQLAHGLAPDLIGATFLANNFEKPFWICPAMNSNMREHPASKQSIEVLSQWGCRILDGQAGMLACGDNGPGRAIEAQQLFELIQEEARRQIRSSQANENLSKFGKPQRKLLLTGGAMSETIDGVREIRNRSTGKTASAIASQFLDNGWEVHYLHHHSAALQGSEGSIHRSYHDYKDFADLVNESLERHEFDAIIHAAAVSDYSLETDSVKASNQKLETSQNLELHLKKNPKILDGFRSGAKGQPIICAFKLTVGQTEAAGLEIAQRFLTQDKADLVVWNDSHLINQNEHNFTLISSLKQKTVNDKAHDEAGLAQIVYKACLEAIAEQSRSGTEVQ